MTAAARTRGVDWDHPEWWVVPIVGAAWIVLAVSALPRSAPVGVPEGGLYALFVCPILSPGSLAPDGGVFVFAGLGSAVMVLAMMGALVLPALHHVGLTGVWARRHRGPALVVGGFLATWLPVVWLLDLAVGTVAATAGSAVAVMLAVAAAVAWQLTPAKARAVRRCGQMIPIPPRGWRADVGCLRLGSQIGGSCVVACGGFMLVAAAAGHGVIAMAALAVVQLHERAARRQRPLPGVVVALAVGAISIASNAAT